MTVDVYTKPACGACTVTKKHLDKSKISYAEADIDSIRAEAMARGILAAPVVVIDGDLDSAWGGYRPDRIDALVP